MGIKQLPSGRFRLQVRRAALQIDEVFETRQDAEASLKLHTGGATGTAAKKTRSITLDDAWGLYKETRDYLEKKPNTRNSEETHIKPVLQVLGSKPVKGLTADDIDAFIVKRTKAGKAPDTIRNEVAALSSVLNYCRKHHIVVANVAIGIKRPSKLPTVHRMPPGHQGALMKILAHPKYRFRAVARLALLVRETGARPGEWVNVQWDDIHLDQHRVVFKNTKYKGMPRTVPLTKAAMALLSAQLEDITINMLDKFGASDWVFPTLSREGEITPLPYSGAVRDMKKEELLPKGLRTHNGRHEFISSLVESSDLDDSRIMALVGHHSPTSMQIYVSARNVRFLPQLEALEEGRRKERSSELAKAMGVPTALIDSYLVHARNEEKADNLDDTGDELLYQANALEKIRTVADRLGSNESDRMRTLLKIRANSTKKPVPPPRGKGA
ncbi:tyrosine-type recombinase/integrase [Rhodoferax sp. U11-2br]|uniref:tyrosine-type recombinase/integrase n=1 Tax=Rhodoferax sp. U11-2br TaxID=2838878 RepID=UPI001BE65EAB|nr:tyrosine-type recombinase/integrase [Rhodoferax sp. U11-2br]MBT3067329.1 tyrosine-type recombinase/integrase [Rhodoferax sp. U11-2br]